MKRLNTLKLFDEYRNKNEVEGVYSKQLISESKRLLVKFNQNQNILSKIQRGDSQSAKPMSPFERYLIDLNNGDTKQLDEMPYQNLIPNNSNVEKIQTKSKRSFKTANQQSRDISPTQSSQEPSPQLQNLSRKETNDQVYNSMRTSQDQNHALKNVYEENSLTRKLNSQRRSLRQETSKSLEKRKTNNLIAVEEKELKKNVVNLFQNRYYSNNFVENAQILSLNKEEQHLNNLQRRFPLTDLIDDLKKSLQDRKGVKETNRKMSQKLNKNFLHRNSKVYNTLYSNLNYKNSYNSHKKILMQVSNTLDSAQHT
eukprot:403338656